MKNTMADLRDHLFGTLESLRNPENEEEYKRAKESAKAIIGIGTVLVKAAKTELDYLKLSGQDVQVKFFEQKQIGGTNG